MPLGVRLDPKQRNPRACLKTQRTPVGTIVGAEGSAACFFVELQCGGAVVLGFDPSCAWCCSVFVRLAV